MAITVWQVDRFDPIVCLSIGFISAFTQVGLKRNIGSVDLESGEPFRSDIFWWFPAK